MKKLNINVKKGFTIIEVVLVLAIAGLIFLMVFVALPNLQRTQRDTQRRDDVSRLSTSLTQYVTNNNKLPGNTTTGLVVAGNLSSNTSAWPKFAYNYLLAGGNDTFEDPGGVPYIITVRDCTSSTDCKVPDSETAFKTFDAAKPTMYILTNAKCGEEGNFTYIKGSRKFAVSMLLESSGYYCVDNG